MSEPITDEELAKMKARCDAATPGPWKERYGPEGCAGLDGPEVVEFEGSSLYYQEQASVGQHIPCFTQSDAALIAHDRTDQPRLIAEVERLRFADDLRELLHGDPFELLKALRLICWYTGELEGHDALVRAGEHLRSSSGAPEHDGSSSQAREHDES